MVTIQKELIDFFTRIAQNSKVPDRDFILAEIKRHRLEVNFLDYLKDTDRQAYANAVKRIAYQQYMNTIFEEEISLLLSQTGDMKIVFLKGYFLAADLYTPFETRKFHDIDILISPNDFKILERILFQLGYTFRTKLNYEILYTKQTKLWNQDFVVKLEVHVSLQLAGSYQIDAQTFVDNAVKIQLAGHQVFVLSPTDNFLFLSIHFIKHFFKSFRFLTSTRPDYIIPLRLLNDIALLLDKYGVEFEWNAVFDKICQYGICLDMLLTAKSFNYIYRPRIPEKIIHRLQAEVQKRAGTKTYSETNRLKQLIYDNLEAFFHYRLSMVDYLVQLLDTNKTTNSVMICSYCSLEAAVDQDKEAFVIPKNGAGPATDLAGSGAFCWNETYLCLQMTLYNQSPVFHRHPIEGCYWDKDTIVLLVITQNSIGETFLLNELYIIPQKTNEGIFLLVTNTNMESIRYPSAACQFKYLDRGYSLLVKIPWELIHVAPYPHLELSINIMLNICEDPIQRRKTKLCLAGNSLDWWDFASYRILKLLAPNERRCKRNIP